MKTNFGRLVVRYLLILLHLDRKGSATNFSNKISAINHETSLYTMYFGIENVSTFIEYSGNPESILVTRSIVLLAEILNNGHLDLDLKHKPNSTAYSVLSAISSLSFRGYLFRIDQVSKNGIIENPNLLISAEASEPSIPFILHQSWKSTNVSTYSKDVHECVQSLDIYAKDFLRVLWTDSDILGLIQTRHKHYLGLYQHLNMKIKRADVARYVILLTFGGLYMDLDIELRRPVSELLRPPLSSPSLSTAISLISTQPPRAAPDRPQTTPQFLSYMTREYETRNGSRNESFAGNAFIASIARPALLARMMQHISSFPQPRLTGVFGVMRHTGPIGLGQVLTNYIQQTKHFQQPSNKSYVDVNRLMISIGKAGRTFFRIQPDRVYFLNSSIVGNMEDLPSHAIHRRRHRWKC